MYNKRMLSLLIILVSLCSLLITIPSVTLASTGTGQVKKKQVRVVTTCRNYDLGSTQQNLDNINKIIDRAAECNPDIIVLCEGVYSLNNWSPAFETIPGPFTDALAKKCKQYKCYVVANMYEDGKDGKRYNTSVLIDKNGKIVGKYRKMKLPPDELKAPYNMVPGTEFKVFDTEFGKISMEICFDIDARFPEITKGHADAGAQLILVSSIGDYTHAAVEFARQNNVFMAVSVTGPYWQDRYPYSSIIAPDGTVINGINNTSNNDAGGPDVYCYADLNLDAKTYSVPVPKIKPILPPPLRTRLPFVSATSSDSTNGTNPEALIDGSIADENMWTSDKNAPSVVFDLGSLKTIGSIGIAQYDVFNQQDYFKLFFSQDGKKFVEYTQGFNYAARSLPTVSAGINRTVDCYAATIFPGMKYVEIEKPFNARYVKLVGYGNSTASRKESSFTEVAAYAPLDPTVTPGPFPTPVPVSMQKNKMIVQIGYPYIEINNGLYEMDPGYETSPVLVNGSTLMPVESIVEVLGGTYYWNANEKKISINSESIKMEMWIGSTKAKVNGVWRTMPAAPKIMNGRIMAPLRFVVENLGCGISWDGPYEKVTISY